METATLRPVWASRSWPLGLLAAACVVLGLFYFGMCLLGLKLAIIHPSITTVWPGTGVALAAFLVLGYRVWPGIFLGAFLVRKGKGVRFLFL